jgi:hypothetical protein
MYCLDSCTSLVFYFHIADEHHQITYDIQGELDGTEQTVIVANLLEEETYEIRVRSNGDGKNSTYTLPIEVIVPKSGRLG